MVDGQNDQLYEAINKLKSGFGVTKMNRRLSTGFSILNGIIPKAEPDLKETLRKLTTEEFYNSPMRVAKAEEARQNLNTELNLIESISFKNTIKKESSGFI